MKTTAFTILFFFIALFAYTKLAGPIPFNVTSVMTTKTDTFTVTGEGKVSVKPDVAMVNVGVQTNGATVNTTQDQLNRNINAVSTAVKKIDVADGDIQTTNYAINPTYDYTSGTQRITGYQASASLGIKVRKIENANAVIDAATKAGANDVGGISFDVDDKTNVQNEARQKAVADAKKKAGDAARTAGFSLGKIINYTEGFVSPRPIPMMAKALAPEAADAAPTQLEQGSSDITVQVTLSYEIR